MAMQTQSQEVPHKGKGKNMVWTVEMDSFLIKSLVKQASLGYKCDKGFKGVAYTATKRAINTNLNIACDVTNIRNRLKTIKTKFKTLKDLMNASGFSWNDVTKMVDAEPEVWSAYIEAHPEAKVWRRKEIANYKELLIICGNDQSTGIYANTPEETCPTETIANGVDVDINEQHMSLERNDEGEQFEDVDNTNSSTHRRASISSVSASGSKRPKKKKRDSENLTERIDGLALTIEKLAGAVERWNPSKVNREELFEEVFKIEDVKEDFLLRAFSYVSENDMRAMTFLALKPHLRKNWLVEVVREAKVSTNELFEEVFKIEGVEDDFLIKAFDYVNEDDKRAMTFFALRPHMRKKWLLMKLGSNGAL